MIRILCSVLFIALIAPPLLAEEPATPPRFFIERIEVRNAKRVSPDVVIAESRLRAEKDYSEEELRDASTRLSRLPFLLSAAFSLEKGVERGHHVLVITINETKPFFYSLDVRPVLSKDFYTHVDLSDHSSGNDTEGVVGMRFFVGRRGAIHFGIYGQDFQNDFANDYTAFAVGYTQYDLFGTHAFATLNLKRVVGGVGNSPGVMLSPQLVVGIPITPNQTVTLGIDDTILSQDDRTFFGQRYGVQRSQRVFTGTWSYNTTNHPFLPTRGTLLQAKPMLSLSDGDAFIFIVGPNPGDSQVIHDKTHRNAVLLEVSGARYWEVSDRDSVSAGITGAFGQVENRSSNFRDTSDDGQYVTLRGGFSHSLWDRNRAKDGDSRLELNARLSLHSGNQFGSGPEAASANRDSRNFTQQVAASWVRRSSWGTLRLGMGYAW